MAHQVVTSGDAFAPVPAGLPAIRTGISYGANWASCELLVMPDTGRRVSAGLAGPFGTPLGAGEPFSSSLVHLKEEPQAMAPPTSTQVLQGCGSYPQQQQQLAGPGTPLKAAPLQVQLAAQGSMGAAPPSPFSVTAVQSGGGEALLLQQQQQQQAAAAAALEVQYVQYNNHMYCQQQQLGGQPPQHFLQHQQQQQAGGYAEDGAAILQQLQYPDAPAAPSTGPGAVPAAAARGGSLLPIGMSPGSSLNLDFQQGGAAASLLDILGDTPVTPPGDACSLDLGQGPLMAGQPKVSLDPVSWLEGEGEEEGKEGEGGEGPWLDLVGAPTAAAGGGSLGVPGGVAAAYRMSSVAAADGWARPGRHSGSSSHGSPLHPSHQGGAHHALDHHQQQQQHMIQQALHYQAQQHYQAAGDMAGSPGDGKFLVPQQQHQQHQQQQQAFTAQQAAFMHLMGHGPAGGAGYM
jgi:hypothetical protein